ncbi:MAG: universal stress protein, partial [Rhodospirillaceae bacterium]|nr:universal stress protein [Rhodospirillaceae bacterium]
MPTSDGNKKKEFTFLCVVDDSEELSRAVRFSCRRAERVGGNVALVYIIQPAEFSHWVSVGDLMREEARQEAEDLMLGVSKGVQDCSGLTPTIYIREGNMAEELIDLIDEEKSISLLVLGAAAGDDGPGPLISYFMEKAAGKLRVPITVVPGNLSNEEIDSIT